MSQIEDYALIGDMETAALVDTTGSIDWLCFPRFDSPACFAALVGTPDNGRWRIAPASPVRKVTRRYRGPTLVLETEFTTADGVVRLVDCMPPREGRASVSVVRAVECVRGTVPMHLELVVRFDYGSIVPWVRSVNGTWQALGGPDELVLRTPVKLTGVGTTTQADFVVRAGEVVPFVLAWHYSARPMPPAIDAIAALRETEAWWLRWAEAGRYTGRYAEAVRRSAITIKALTYQPTGGIIAAPTTSLPEFLGGVRNWDYRDRWLRDATFSLDALLACGYTAEATAWRDWLLRAIAGDAGRLQIMYGVTGTRRLPELDLPWLAGFAGSHPVRVGNAAYSQRQLDVYGELMDAMYLARRAGLPDDENVWRLQEQLLNALEHVWPEPDHGIWEVRGPRRHFTHSKVMAWVAFDRGLKTIERFGGDGPRDRWQTHRDRLHAEILSRGYNASLRAFTQYYGSTDVDASLLMLPLVGFLPPDDPRIVGTVGAVERTLVDQGFVNRYRTSPDGTVDGLPHGEGVFLPCTFWLADNYILQGRRAEARALFERLLAITNDVGLLPEEYDPAGRHFLGNFPQAFTHVALINTAHNLSHKSGPGRHRR